MVRSIPEDALALLTTAEIGEKNPVMMADFRDSMVLVHRASGCFLGISRGHGVRLCSRRPFMRDGIWCARADEDAQLRFPSIVLGPGDVSLEAVE